MSNRQSDARRDTENKRHQLIDVIAALKDNQPKLRAEVEGIFDVEWGEWRSSDDTKQPLD
ncbi:MAG: hypothetical protein J2P31_04575 [Blastocatellia bacterium]|nr:hypothetical protein [Blastocatellia bacterium]